MYHIRSFILCFSLFHLHYKNINDDKIAEVTENNKISKFRKFANVNVKLNLIKKDSNIIATIIEQFFAQFLHCCISFNFSLKFFLKYAQSSTIL